MTAADTLWLDAAVALAAPLRGTTADNPTVGAIVVDPENNMLGQGVTAPGGRPHAEPQALDMAGERAHGATLYVTLEPCHHWGRSPPCVEAVIASGVARVVIGLIDPDPRTAGESVKLLRAMGVDVIVADHAPSRRLHEGFVARVTTGRPFVTVKLAVSADGMIGRFNVPNVAITGAAARDWTHRLRAVSDAIMVGGRTAVIDNPNLTVRLADVQRSPLRLVLAGSEPLPTGLNLFAQTSAYPTAVLTISGAHPSLPLGVQRIQVAGEGARPKLASALDALGQLGIQNLLVEAGAGLAEALLSANLVDRFAVLTSPVIIGPDGLRATPIGTIGERIAEAGLAEVDRQPLGSDMVALHERAR